MMARSPSLDETHELLPFTTAAANDDDLVEYVLPDNPVEHPAAAPCTPLKLDLSALADDTRSTPTSTSKSAKRRSLQEIPYRYHPHGHQLPLSPLGRSSEDSPSFTFHPGPSAGSPSLPAATDDVPHRPKRFSFSPSAGNVRPTALELGRVGTRHRSTLSTPVFHSPPSSSSSRPATNSPSSTSSSAADASQRASPPLEPLSHADLLGSFVALHSKRRLVLVHLLALRKTASSSTGDDVWSAVDDLVGTLAGSFESERRDVRLALLGAPSSSPLLHAADDEEGSFAPPSQTQAELEREAVSDLRTFLASLSTSLDEVERARETGTFDAAWLGLREDVGEVVRSWERGRLALDLRPTGGLERDVQERVLPAQLNVAGWESTSSSEDLTSPSADPTHEGEEKEDDVTLFQRSSTILAVAGREVLFSATSTPPVVLRPPSGLSRAERIRLARELRADVQAGKKKIKKEKRGPEGMGEVIGELNGLMGVLRRLKASPLEEEEANVELSSERPPSSKQQPLTASQGNLRAGGRSSLPALSQGSSDGSQESDESETQLEVGVDLRRAGESQGTLKASSSTEKGDGAWRTVDEEGRREEGVVLVQEETLLP